MQIQNNHIARHVQDPNPWCNTRPIVNRETGVTIFINKVYLHVCMLGLVKYKGFQWSIPDLCLLHVYAYTFNPSPPSAAYLRQWSRSALVQIMTCRVFGAKPLSKLMLGSCYLNTYEQTSMKVRKIQNFPFTEVHLKMSSEKVTAILSRGEMSWSIIFVDIDNECVNQEAHTCHWVEVIVAWQRNFVWFGRNRNTVWITRYVNGTPTSEVTPVTIRYIHPPNHGYPYATVMVMNDRLSPFVPCQSAPPPLFLK